MAEKQELQKIKDYFIQLRDANEQITEDVTGPTEDEPLDEEPEEN